MQKNKYRISLLVIAMAIGIFTSCNNNKTEALEQEITKLNKKIEQLEQEKTILLEQLPNIPQEGVFFEVQIGAFEHFNLEAYLADFVRLREVYDDGMFKYVLGRFRKYSDAQSFRLDLRKMGIDDAFIIALDNGRRIVDEQDVEELGRNSE